MFLDTPPWSSDRDPQRSFPIFKRFDLMTLLTFSGAGRIMWLSGCPCRFWPSRPNAILGYARLSLAFLCRSLLPGLKWLRKLSLAFFMSLTSPLGSRQPSTMRGSIASAPIANRGHEISRWLLHAVYLIYANWGLNFLSSGSREIENFRTRPWAFIRLHLDGSLLVICKPAAGSYFPTIPHLLVEELAPSIRWIIDTGDRRLSCSGFCSLRHPCHSLRSFSDRQSHLSEECIIRPADQSPCVNLHGKEVVPHPIYVGCDGPVVCLCKNVFPGTLASLFSEVWEALAQKINLPLLYNRERVCFGSCCFCGLTHF